MFIGLISQIANFDLVSSSSIVNKVLTFNQEDDLNENDIIIRNGDIF
jgi:hypothetical protein